MGTAHGGECFLLNVELLYPTEGSWAQQSEFQHLDGLFVISTLSDSNG